MVTRTSKEVVIRVIAATAITLAVIGSLTGCAVDATVRPVAAELPGQYYSGDGLGYNVTVTLNSDGTYISDWQGCLGTYGSASGTWHLSDDQLVFYADTEHDLLIGYLRKATTIRHHGKLGFVREEDLSDQQIDEYAVFFKLDPTEQQ